MRMAWKIFRRDVRRISHNIIASIVIVGLCFIPALYAWFNIAANIDPYSNTSNIKVAIVNEDKGSTADKLGHVNVGDQIEDRLKDNDQIGWVFTGSDDAIEGVRSGKYYAALVIPENFSDDITSVLDGKIEQPEIDYYINEKKNAIAPKITDTAASTLQTQINEAFVGVVSDTVTKALNRAGGSVVSGLNNAQGNLSAKLTSVDDKLAQYEELVDSFTGSYDTSLQALHDAEKLLDQIDAASAKSVKTLNKTDKLLQQSRKSATTYTSQLSTTLESAQGTMTQIRSDSVTAAGKMAVPLGTLNGTVDGLVESAQSTLELNNQIIDGLQDLDSSLPGSPAADLIRTLTAENERHQELLTALGAGNTAIGNASSNTLTFINSVNSTLNKNDQALSGLRQTYLTGTLPVLNSSLDSLSTVSGTMRGALTTVPTSTATMRAALREMESCLKNTNTSLGKTKIAIGNARESLRGIRADLSTLISSNAYKELTTMTELDPDQVSDFLSSPIHLTTKGYYPVMNYGSAMMPFYTNLAMWIAGIVLAAVLKLRTDADEEIPEFTARESYFGRWLLFVVLGLIQGLITMLGNLILLDVQCLHPLAFIFAGLVTSFVYVNIIFALTLTFNHIGRAFCVLLVILQIPGSAGTYPIEMMPRFFRALNPLLPFTYSISAMREAIAGFYQHEYSHNLMILLIYLVIALFIGVIYQPMVMNLDNMFDDRLSQTGLMISERENPLQGRINLSHMLWVLTEEDTTKDAVMARAIRFEEKYPRRARRGLHAFAILPWAFLLLAFTGIRHKLLFLSLWIISLILIAFGLIVLEYIHESIVQRLGLTDVPQAELLERVRTLRRRIKNRKEADNE